MRRIMFPLNIPERKKVMLYRASIKGLGICGITKIQSLPLHFLQITKLRTHDDIFNTGLWRKVGRGVDH